MSEKQYVETMINLYGKPGKMFAMVGDTYDIFSFCEMLGDDPNIRSKIINHGESGGFTIVRPDSGNPSDVVVRCLQILDKKFGSVVNAKGYKVLNNVRIIQGDGIDHTEIQSILFCMELAGYSSDNVAFGQGGGLLQHVNRDTMKFAMKCSSILVNGVARDVFKDPVTDPGKQSKKGRVTTYTDGTNFVTGVEGVLPTQWTDKGVWTEALQTVFENGELKNEITFEQVRANARK